MLIEPGSATMSVVSTTLASRELFCRKINDLVAIRGFIAKIQ